MISKNRQLNGDSVIPAWSADLYTVIPAGSARIQMPWKGSHIPVAWIPALPAGTTTFSQFNGSELTGIVMEKQPCVYLLASRRNGTLYIGVTSDLIKRVFQHRNGQVDGFTKRYGIHNLVWYEIHERMESAILREKHLKTWDRRAKIGLIEQHNPVWRDLWQELICPSMAPGFRHSLPE